MADFTIGKRSVESAGAGRHYDSKLAGFGLTVGATGTRAYFIEYRPGRGRSVAKRRYSFARHGEVSPAGKQWTADAARSEAIRLLGRIKAGVDPLGDRDAERIAQTRTVAVVAEDWLRRDQAKNKDVARVRRIMATEVLPAIGKMRIEDVKKAHIIALIDTVTDRAPVHANRVLAHVRRLFNWACGRDLIEHSPVAHIEKPTPESRRDRVLDDNELIAIWRAADRMGGPFGEGVKLLMLSAARRDEIFGARRTELDLKARCLRLPAGRAKSKDGRAIALPLAALEIIEGLPRFAAGDWLLTVDGHRPYGGYSTGKAKLDAEIAAMGAQVAPWVLHDLRRTCATALQRQGERLEVIESILGHVSGTRTGLVATYQRHRFETEGATAMERWGDYLARLLDPPPDTVVPMRRAQ